MRSTPDRSTVTAGTGARNWSSVGEEEEQTIRARLMLRFYPDESVGSR